MLTKETQASQTQSKEFLGEVPSPNGRNYWPQEVPCVVLEQLSMTEVHSFALLQVNYKETAQQTWAFPGPLTHLSQLDLLA